MIAIHPPSPRSRTARLAVPAALLAAVLAWCGCGGEPSEAPGAERGPYGDPYEVVLGFGPAGPDTPPALEGDTLVALLTYTGGCEDHDFDLEVDEARDTTRLWLVHDAHGDGCEEQVQDTLRLPVPAGLEGAAAVVLLHPRDPFPFVLRWRQE